MLAIRLTGDLMRAHGGELILRRKPWEDTTATMRIPAERLLPNGVDLPEDAS